MKRNYYLILGVTSDASREEIHNAYRRLVKMIHPDVSGSDSGDRFREVQEAWETLGDEQRRRDYDSILKRAQHRSSRTRSAPMVDRHSFSRSRFGVYDQASEEVGAIYDSTAGAQEIHFGLEMTADEAATGGQVTLRIPVQVRCADCGGMGTHLVFLCPACRGTGYCVYQRTFTLEIPGGVERHSTLQVRLAAIGLPQMRLVLHVEIDALP